MFTACMRSNGASVGWPIWACPNGQAQKKPIQVPSLRRQDQYWPHLGLPTRASPDKILTGHGPAPIRHILAPCRSAHMGQPICVPSRLACWDMTVSTANPYGPNMCSHMHVCCQFLAKTTQIVHSYR